MFPNVCTHLEVVLVHLENILIWYTLRSQGNQWQWILTITAPAGAGLLKQPTDSHVTFEVPMLYSLRKIIEKQDNYQKKEKRKKKKKRKGKDNIGKKIHNQAKKYVDCWLIILLSWHTYMKYSGIGTTLLSRKGVVSSFLCFFSNARKVHFYLPAEPSFNKVDRQPPLRFHINYICKSSVKFLAYRGIFAFPCICIALQQSSFLKIITLEYGSQNPALCSWMQATS